MKNSWLKLFKQSTGSVTIELAFVLGFMVIAFAGLVELTTFIDAKQRVNKLANQAANVMSTLPSWQGATATDLANTLKISAYGIKPQGGVVRARFCTHGTTVKIDGSNYVSGYTQNDACGLATGPGAPKLYPKCSETSGPGTDEYVSVVAYCTYHPVVTMFNFVKEMRIDAVLNVPMRNSMGW